MTRNFQAFQAFPLPTLIISEVVKMRVGLLPLRMLAMERCRQGLHFICTGARSLVRVHLTFTSLGGGWTVLSCSEDRKLRQIFRNKQALRRSLLTCDVSNSDNMRTLLCSVMGNKGQNTHNTKSQNYVICLNEEGYTEITLTDLQLM